MDQASEWLPSLPPHSIGQNSAHGYPKLQKRWRTVAMLCLLEEMEIDFGEQLLIIKYPFNPETLSVSLRNTTRSHLITESSSKPRSSPVM